MKTPYPVIVIELGIASIVEKHQ